MPQSSLNLNLFFPEDIQQLVFLFPLGITLFYEVLFFFLRKRNKKVHYLTRSAVSLHATG